MTRPIRLRSPLDPVAAAHKLKAAVEAPHDGETSWIAGSGTDRTMTLGRVRRWQVNSFAPRLVATMRGESGGTLIEGRIGMPRGVKLFMALWFGFLILFLLASVPLLAVFRTVAVGGAGALSAIWLLGTVPLAMIGFGVLLLVVGRRMAAGDEAVILDWLAATIDARPEPG